MDSQTPNQFPSHLILIHDSLQLKVQSQLKKLHKCTINLTEKHLEQFNIYNMLAAQNLLAQYLNLPDLPKIQALLIGAHYTEYSLTLKAHTIIG